MVKITEKGIKANQKQIRLKDVEGSSDFLNFYSYEKNKKTEKTEMNNSSPQDLIDTGFTAIESQVKTDLLDKLKEINYPAE